MAMSVEISCINKTPRFDPWDRIQFIGGINPNGSRWKLSQPEAIAGIENGTWDFYVGSTILGRVPVIIATSRFGNRYLKTQSDGEHPNNLLSLPECP